jgi:hypothetical protein
MAGTDRSRTAKFRRPNLRSVRLSEPALLGFGWMADREALLATIGPGPINRWSNSVIEFAAYMATAEERTNSWDAENLNLLLRAQQEALDRAPADFVSVDPRTRRAHQLIRHAFIDLHLGGSREAIATIDQALKLALKDLLVRRARGYIAVAAPKE